jgi:hypothetical protein
MLLNLTEVQEDKKAKLSNDPFVVFNVLFAGTGPPLLLRLDCPEAF